MNNQVELTSRQWALWRLIEHNSLVEHRKTTQKEICEKIEGYVYKERKNSTDCCSAIWSDVKQNNESLEHDKVIITKNYEYWIGSEQETKIFILNLWKQLAPRLHRYWFLLNKIKRDGQGKIISNQGNPIDENSTAKKFHECFNNYDVEMQKELTDLEEEQKEENE